MAAVTLENVCKVYPDGHTAVAEASFQAADGELVVLVGPSGCGKSTLLRMIAGLESISAGILRIGDRIVNQVAPRERDVAMVFQNYALYPHMTVAENLGFALKLRALNAGDRRRSQIDQQVRAAADLLSLTDVLDRLPAQLSGGQRQRVALGRALVRQPQVFLLDEPLSNLDARLRASTRVEIARLHRRLGTTMLYVTHDQVEAMTLGQRIVVLDHGRIQQIDTPMVLYQRPANRFVATFLGSPAMNLLRGKVTQEGRGQVFDLGGGLRLPLPDGDVPTEWIGRELDLGIRPEHLLRDDTQDGFVPVVEVVEPVGSEVLVNLRHGTHDLVARLAPGDLPRPGDPLPLRLSPRHAHWFDPADGRRLNAGNA